MSDAPLKKKFAVCLARLLPARLARRFVREQDGIAAVEFALVATPFLALIFAILETAMVFFAGQTMEATVAESARLIMTGQAQTSGWSKADFKTAVCARVYGLFDCANGMTIDVKTYANFAAYNYTPPVTGGTFNSANANNYTPGGPGCIVVVTAYYQWPVYVSMFNDNLSNLSGGKRLLVATSVFRNEPYGPAGSC